MERPPEDRVSSLTIIWRTLADRRWMIAGLVFLALFATAFLVALEPRLYEAQVEIIALAPAWENNKGALMAPVASTLSVPFRPLKLVLTESLYWELYARVLMEAIIKELGLQTHYGTPTLAQTVRVLEASRSIQLTNQGTLQVRVMDRDPDMAAAIANAHARHLDLLDRRLLVQSASLRRRFIEARIREAQFKLARAEEAWMPLWFKNLMAGAETQEMKRSFAPENASSLERRRSPLSFGGADKQFGQEDQQNESEDDDEQVNPLTRTTMLKLKAMELETELAGLRSFTTSAHPETIQLDARLKALRRAIDRLERGSRGGRSVQPSLAPPLVQLPELALSSQRLDREAGAQGRYYLFWRQALEDVTVEQALDLPRVWVLDHAVPEERPRRLWQKVIVAGGFALILGVLLSFLFTYLDRLRALAPPTAPTR